MYVSICLINLFEHILSVVFVFLSKIEKDMKYVSCYNVNVLMQIQIEGLISFLEKFRVFI